MTLAATDRAAFEQMAAGMEKAWNSGDGDGFAAFFADDADFVNIYGMHAQGKLPIAAGHNMILRSGYAGSVVRYAVTHARLISPDVAVVHLNAHLEVPEGPLAGEMEALPSMVVTRNGAGWLIAAFHNTLVQAPPAVHNNGRPH